jgi:hypothetical protein
MWHPAEDKNQTKPGEELGVWVHFIFVLIRIFEGLSKHCQTKGRVALFAAVLQVVLVHRKME